MEDLDNKSLNREGFQGNFEDSSTNPLMVLIGDNLREAFSDL
jgi:hypothetical protein